jgi:hypothetical protein
VRKIMSQDDSATPGPTTEHEHAWITSIGSAAIIAIVIVIGFTVYTIHHRDDLSAYANSWAETFIRSSPVVEQQLGHVRTIKRISEEDLSGKSPSWYVDYDVTGRHGMGVVEMRLTPIEYQGWNVPLAELDEGHRKPINLR